MKTYPDHTLRDALYNAGHSYRLMWEIRGPKNTSIAWMTCYLVNGCTVIVQTFKDRCGWQAFTHNHSIGVDDVVADVIAHCGLDRAA